MGTHDHHISARWEEMVEVFKKYGDEGFCGHDNLLEGVNYQSTFTWDDKMVAYYFGDYFNARLRENLPLNTHEQILYDFLRAYSFWPKPPPTDLPVKSSVVFKPERVQMIAKQLARLNLDTALEWYDYFDPPPAYYSREEMHDHLRRVVTLWLEAAGQGDAVLYTVF